MLLNNTALFNKVKQEIRYTETARFACKKDISLSTLKKIYGIVNSITKSSPTLAGLINPDCYDGVQKYMASVGMPGDRKLLHIY